MGIIKFFIVVVFIYYLVISWRFQFRSEGKDERGQKIINTAYMTAFPIFPFGWFIMALYHDFIHPIEYGLYRDLIWILVLGGFIVHGVTISILKRKW